jgi:hypothetical protein
LPWALNALRYASFTTDYGQLTTDHRQVINESQLA